MLKHPTYDQPYALGLHGMAKALVEIAAAGEADGLGHHEWLGLYLIARPPGAKTNASREGCALRWPAAMVAIPVFCATSAAPTF